MSMYGSLDGKVDNSTYQAGGDVTNLDKRFNTDCASKLLAVCDEVLSPLAPSPHYTCDPPPRLALASPWPHPQLDLPQSPSRSARTLSASTSLLSSTSRAPGASPLRQSTSTPRRFMTTATSSSSPTTARQQVPYCVTRPLDLSRACRRPPVHASAPGTSLARALRDQPLRAIRNRPRHRRRDGRDQPQVLRHRGQQHVRQVQVRCGSGPDAPAHAPAPCPRPLHLRRAFRLPARRRFKPKASSTSPA